MGCGVLCPGLTGLARFLFNKIGVSKFLHRGRARCIYFSRPFFSGITLVEAMVDFVQRVEHAITSAVLIERGSSVVAGISGGADSVALVSTLFELRERLGFELVLAHLNHCLRGKESDEDERWVREFASHLGLSLYVERLENPPASGVEQWSRGQRYDFLVRTALSHGAPSVAVGHHADDVAETFLINLLRGAGMAGLSSMSPSRKALPYSDKVYIVRPLLGIFRSDVREYLQSRGLGWREDTSNLDPGFLRNRVRHQVMPLLEDINPAVSRVLARSAAVLRKEYGLLCSLAEDWLDRNGGEGDGLVVLDRDSLLSEPAGLCLAVLRESVRRAKGDLLSISASHLEDISELIYSGGAGSSLDLPGVRIFIEKEGVTIERTAKEESGIARKQRWDSLPDRLLLEVPGSVDWPGPGGYSYRVSTEVVDSRGSPELFCRAYLSRPGLKGRLRVRRFREGDRFHPFGGQRRKLSRFMKELGIPWRDREAWPLLEDSAGLVWVPGLWPAARVSEPEAGPLIKVEVSPCLGGNR